MDLPRIIELQLMALHRTIPESQTMCLSTFYMMFQVSKHCLKNLVHTLLQGASLDFSLGVSNDLPAPDAKSMHSRNPLLQSKDTETQQLSFYTLILCKECY